MSVRIKVSLLPLAPYFFGGEQNAGFGQTKPAPYFIRSENVPAQSTLLGVMRYAVLKRHGALTPQFSHGSAPTQALRQRQAELVGRQSFSFDRDCGQGFGHIEELSPLFLEHDGVLYARCPLNHNPNFKLNQTAQTETKYTPYYNIRKHSVGTADGQERWSLEGFEPKCGLYNGWVSLDGEGKLVADREIFLSQEQVGIIKSERGAQESGFFKKEYKRLANGWAFVCFLQMQVPDDLPGTATVQMGQSGSLFQMAALRDETDWRASLSHLYKAYGGYKGAVYYAASDSRPGCNAKTLYEQCDLAITLVRPFRSLTLEKGAETYLKSMKKTKRFDLLRSGSVFYVPENRREGFERLFKSKAYETAGFNQLYLIGGAQQ